MYLKNLFPLFFIISTAVADCSHGEVNLEHSSHCNEGTVQLCIYTQWGSISRFNFDHNDAKVLCRQLGYNVDSPGNTVAYVEHAYQYYGYGSGVVWTIGPQCDGTEDRILDCKSTYTSRTYDHSDDVGLICPAPSCSDGAVRLVGGLVGTEGTVEVCDNGAWNSVCHSDWGYQEAFVVCRQLNLPTTDVQYYSSGPFGWGHGIPTLNNWRCSGNETSLSSCIHGEDQNCYVMYDVGVSCQGMPLEARCLPGNMQLLGPNGPDKTEGRVEYCTNGLWGTVSSQRGFGANDGKVVCRRLGFQTPRVQLFNSSYYGEGTGPIVYNGLDCGGSESKLEECSTSDDPYYTTHFYDVGIKCYEKDGLVVCNDGEVRLSGGSSNYEGRVEVCYNNEWGTVLDDSFNRNAARVICRQLGHDPPYATVHKDSHFGDGSLSVLVNTLSCSGSDRNINECSLDTSNVEAFYGNTAGVSCYATTGCTNGSIRLVGGEISKEGDVQICQEGMWGYICSDRWSETETRAVCRQLKYSSSWYSTSEVSFFSSNKDGLAAPIIVDGYSCSSNAVQLSNCSTTYEYATINANCINVVGVMCEFDDHCSNGSVRLVGGHRSSEGRVELCTDGVWMTILDSGWDYKDAQVVCRELGFRDLWAVPISEPYILPGYSRVHFSEVFCNGSEENLVNCSHNTLELSDHIEDWYNSERAGVSCETQDADPCYENGSVRLVAGASKREGRAEVCMGGYWGTVCSDGWSEEDALVVCRQAGYSTLKPVPMLESSFGRGSGPVQLTSVSCSGSEELVSECEHNSGIGAKNCHHERDAGVLCTGGIPHYYFIEISTSPSEGPIPIGSEVTLHCSVSPYPHGSVTYHWTTSVPGVSITHEESSAPNATVTISAGHTKHGYYYCVVQSNNSTLASGFVVLEIQDLLAVNDSEVQLQQASGSSVILDIYKTSDAGITKYLRELNWYYGDSNVPLTTDGHKYELKHDNMSLVIMNFSSLDTGTYTAKYDGLLLYPHKEYCEQQVLRVLQRHPLLRPITITLSANGIGTSDSTTLNAVLKSNSYISRFTKGHDLSITITASTLSQDDLFIKEFKNGAATPLKRTKQYKLVSPPQFYIEYKKTSPNLFDSGMYEFQLLNNYTPFLLECPKVYSDFIQENSYLNLSGVVVESLPQKVSYFESPEVQLIANMSILTANEHTNLTCSASKGYPLFHNITLMKNDQVILNKTAHEIVLSTSTQPVEKFGVYKCLVNNSVGVTELAVTLLERASLVMLFDTENCQKYKVDDFLRPVSDLLVSYCACSLDQSSLINSTLSCSNGALQFEAELLFSSDDGSVTASTAIALMEYHVAEQSSPVLTVDGEDLPIITSTSTSSCPLAQLILMFLGGVGATIAFCTFIAVAFCFIYCLLKRIARKRRITKHAQEAENAAAQQDTVRYVSATGVTANISSGGKNERRKKKDLSADKRSTAKNAAHPTTSTPAAKSNNAKATKAGQASKPATKAAQSTKTSGPSKKHAQTAKTTSALESTASKPTSVPEPSSTSVTMPTLETAPVQDSPNVFEVHDELEIGSDEELYDDIEPAYNN